MQITYRIATACSTALLVVGCAKSDQAAKDTTAMATPAGAPAAAPAPAPTIALADVAGKWQMRAVPESGADTTPTTYVLTATADTTGWTVAYPSKLTVPVHVMVSGDSVINHAGPYSSQRKKGLKVTTDGAMHLKDGKLTGFTVAHYTTTGADSVLRLRVEGTKMP